MQSRSNATLSAETLCIFHNCSKVIPKRTSFVFQLLYVVVQFYPWYNLVLFSFVLVYGVNYLLTRGKYLRENLKPRPCHIDQEIVRSIHQGGRLRSLDRAKVQVTGHRHSPCHLTLVCMLWFNFAHGTIAYFALFGPHCNQGSILVFSPSRQKGRYAR